MRTALAMKPDGTTIRTDLPDDTDGQLRTMHAAIGGGCTSAVPVMLATGLDMWVDEEGLHGQPVNLPATLIARSFGLGWQDYHGTALFTGADNGSGPASLGNDQINALIAKVTLSA